MFSNWFVAWDRIRSTYEAVFVIFVIIDDDKQLRVKSIYASATSSIDDNEHIAWHLSQ